jgi:hypothetical protein
MPATLQEHVIAMVGRPMGGSVRWVAAVLVALHFLVLAPATVPGQSVVVAVIGDFGAAVESSTSASNELAVANLVKRWNPDFVLTLGDNNYPGGLASTIDPNIGQFYHEYIHPYLGAYGSGATSNRFFPCLGNHDWVQNGQPSIDYFALPGNERYYRYRATPDLEWFAVNSNPDSDGTSPTSVQGVWLRDALTNSTARWKLVYFHHPPYSANAGAAGNAYMRWPFATWGATMVLAGHDHVYARLLTNGLTYIINGLGGDDIGSLGSPAPGSMSRYSGDFGALRVEASATNLVSHFINRNNTIIDTFVFGDPAANPFILASPSDQTVPAGRTVQFTVLATGTPAPAYQWLSNSIPLPGATSGTLTLRSVEPQHEAEYAALVTSGGAVRRTAPARLTLLRHPLINLHPRSLLTNGGATVTFRVMAEGAGTLRYQWSFNDVLLPGATSSNLVLTNVTLASAGNYRVLVSDELGSVLSNPGILTVLARPIVIQHPVGQTAVEGDSVTWSVTAEGTLPMNFSWRINSQIITNIMLPTNICFWTVPNVRTNSAGNYQVGVTNVAGPAARLTSNAFLVVLADRDGDRLPDAWETEFGFNPDDPSDAGLDLDGDGAGNLAERIAGTDPNSALSCLRIEPLRRPMSGGWELQFTAVSNRTYAVEFCDEPRSGAWQRLAEIPASGTNRVYTIVDGLAPPGGASRFYRVATPR